MSDLNKTALNCFLATSFLATATILIGYGVSNYNKAEYNKQFGPVQVYTLPTTPATGEHTAY